jgi:hypothetical protein
MLYLLTAQQVESYRRELFSWYAECYKPNRSSDRDVREYVSVVPIRQPVPELAETDRAWRHHDFVCDGAEPCDEVEGCDAVADAAIAGGYAALRVVARAYDRAVLRRRVE